MATIIGRVVHTIKGLPHIKSNYSLITWFYKIKYQIKTIRSPLHSVCNYQIGVAMTNLERLLLIKTHDLLIVVLHVHVTDYKIYFF